MVLRLAEKHSLVTISELLGLPLDEVVSLAEQEPETLEPWWDVEPEEDGEEGADVPL